jgi:N-acyl-D-amino-acid deacylase
MILFRGGSIYDGRGGEPFLGDVLADGDRIVAVGRVDGVPVGARVIDCAGLAVAPGLIDSHSHSDLQVLENRPEKLNQGVTTEVVGNCGFSPYPCGHDPRMLRDFANGIFCGAGDWGWRTAGEYLDETSRRAALNVFSLVGHGSLRMARTGLSLGAVAESDLDWMEHILAEALDQGACGFSTGLMYFPGASAPIEELERFCRVVARRGKIYTTHMRDYSDALIEAVEEQLELARRTGCRLQISHMQAVGPRNWPKQRQALDLIEDAAQNGVDVGFDCYPYICGSTVMTQLLPQWALDGGIDGLAARLADPAMRKRITTETDAVLAQGWKGIAVAAAGSPRNQGLVGKTVAEIAEALGREPVEVVCDLIIEERGQVAILEYNQSEENLRETLTHPLSTVISDGFYVNGRPHPRLYGTFPLWLGEMSRNRGWIGLAEAILKVTAKPAERFGMTGRGRLDRGCCADVMVFDPASVGSPATYEEPRQAPTGIRHVFRNGVELAGRS